MMRIGLIGKGKMGQAILAQSQLAGHKIVKQFDSCNPVSADAVRDIDVLIDVSIADAVRMNVETALKARCPIVTGTTGWDGQYDDIRNLVQKYNGSFLYAPNFSIGVLLFQKLAQYSARLFARFPNYDFGIHEIHHRKKSDSPSGTARMLGETLLRELPQKDRLQIGNSREKISPNALQISSGRIGSVPGTHHILIDSPAESIQLTHIARGRAGFAEGALTAAKWLIGKTGFYSIQDMLEDMTNS